MSGAVLNRKTKTQTGGLEGLVGHDIEVRAVGGAVVRGQLTAVDSAYLYILRHTGRGALVARAAALVVVDEETLVPHGASRQDAEDTFGGEV